MLVVLIAVYCSGICRSYRPLAEMITFFHFCWTLRPSAASWVQASDVAALAFTAGINNIWIRLGTSRFLEILSLPCLKNNRNTWIEKNPARIFNCGAGTCRHLSLCQRAPFQLGNHIWHMLLSIEAIQLTLRYLGSGSKNSQGHRCMETNIIVIVKLRCSKQRLRQENGEWLACWRIVYMKFMPSKQSQSSAFSCWTKMNKRQRVRKDKG